MTGAGQKSDGPLAANFRLHHIGYLAAVMEEAVAYFRDVLGYLVESDPIDDIGQTARVQFLRQPGMNCWLEIVSPLGENSKLSAAVERGVCLHHICYEVPDVIAAMDVLRKKGCMPISKPVPGAAFDGRLIAWVMDPMHGLTELLTSGPGIRSLDGLTDQLAREGAQP